MVNMLGKRLSKTLLIVFVWSGARVRKSCRARKMLQDGYFLAEIGFDTAANEPSKVCCVCAHPELKECESYVTDPPRPGQRDALPTAAGLPGCFFAF